jgi:hypothetical protein
MRRSKNRCKRRGGGPESSQSTDAQKKKGFIGRTWDNVVNMLSYVSKNSNNFFPLIWKCFELEKPIGMFTRYLILFAFVLFTMLPIIVVVLCIAFLIDLVSKVYKGRNADFYGDTIMSTQVSRIYAFGDSYVNEYILTFFIILVLYVISILIYLFVITRRLGSDCHIRTFFEKHFITSVIFYGILLAIVIIDVLNFKEFTDTVGALRVRAETKIKNIINSEYIDKLVEGKTSSSAIIDGNSLSSLQKYINEQAAKETSADINQIKQNTPYANIKTACLTYLIIKTLDENDYANKRIVVVDKAFLTNPSSLYLSISYTTNQLIYANIKKCFKFDENISKFWTTIKTSIIEDCVDVRKGIDDDVLQISHKTASTISSKVVFFSLLTTLCKMAFDYSSKLSSGNDVLE